MAFVSPFFDNPSGQGNGSYESTKFSPKGEGKVEEEGEKKRDGEEGKEEAAEEGEADDSRAPSDQALVS